MMVVVVCVVSRYGFGGEQEEIMEVMKKKGRDARGRELCVLQD